MTRVKGDMGFEYDYLNVLLGCVYQQAFRLNVIFSLLHLTVQNTIQI